MFAPQGNDKYVRWYANYIVDWSFQHIHRSKHHIVVHKYIYNDYLLKIKNLKELSCYPKCLLFN
jgi:hypothetical protein